MIRWEYRVVAASPDADSLSQLGADGWELCGALDGRLYFKRPAPTLQERITLDQRHTVLSSGRPLEERSEGHGNGTERILHPELRRLLAEAGHTDLLVVCDRGFPVPPGIERIDLALTDGLPTVLDVLRCVRSEVRGDRLLLAEEARSLCPERIGALIALLPDTPLAFIPHLELKAVARAARGVIRTGDDVPYANVILAVG